MTTFISISKYKGDQGQIFTCAGNLFATMVDKKQIVICSTTVTVNNKTVVATYTQEIAYRSTDTINFAPYEAAAQGSIYPGTEMDSNRERSIMYATKPMSISGLLFNGYVVATSKKEPLILHYKYSSSTLGVYLYNLKYRTSIGIVSAAVDNIDTIESCQFAIGGFASTKQQDIYISCSLLGIINGFYIRGSTDGSVSYSYSDRGLGAFCSDGSVLLGDYNGDKLSDLLCLDTGYAMINKKDSFRGTNLIRTQPGNWGTQINNYGTQKNIAVGDFDGNGISDLASISDGARPEILFHNGLNKFISYTGDSSDDGSFTFNSINYWCGTDGNAQVIAIDADNDGKDDLLCKNNEANTTNSEHGKVYLALSRTTSYTAIASSTNQKLKKIVVTLDDFTIGNNIGFEVIDKNVPLFCDASKIYEYHTKMSCSLNSVNKIEQFTNPIQPSNSVPELEINTNIKGNIYLGDKDKYGDIDLVNEQIYNEASKPRYPKGKLWKWDSVNFVDPTRHFETIVHTNYIRQGKIKEKRQHLGDHSYGYRVHGGDCNEINFNHIALTYKFTAIGRMIAYDQDSNRFTDSDLIRNLAEMYILAGYNSTADVTDAAQINNKIESVGGGIVTFSFTGEMKVQTLYQKNVTHCSVQDITQNDITIANNQNVASNTENDQSAVCLLQGDTASEYTSTSPKAGLTRGASLLARENLLEINGIIHMGGAFFPDEISDSNTETLSVDRYGAQVNDVHCRLNYDNGIELHAYVDADGKYYERRPHNELKVEFKQDDEVIYEPTRIRDENGTVSEIPAALYAGFDNIKLIKLVAFDAKHILLAWSIYQAEEKQYYLLVDYLNTGNSILRIPLYEYDFNIVITNKRYGNEFYVTYRTSPDKLIITKYSSDNFAATNSIEIGTEDLSTSSSASIEKYINTYFELQAEETTTDDGTIESNLVLIRSHNNEQGKFVRKYDILLNKAETEVNIVCDATDQNAGNALNLDKVPTKIDDEGYDILRLNYQHNSKVIYHSNDNSENLVKKIKLQNSLNFIYKGINHLQTLVSNPDQTTQSKIKTSFEGIICKSSLTFASLNALTKRTANFLSSDLTFEIHTDESSKDSKCSSTSSYYPVYREGSVIHLCSGFDEVISNIDECNRLIDSSSYIKGFVLPETPVVHASLLSSLLPYLPSNVIERYAQIINSDYVSPGEIAAICHEAGAYGDQSVHVRHIANNILGGLMSVDAPKVKVTIGSDTYSCNNMAARACSTSYDKQTNSFCVANLFEMSSIASLITEAAHLNSNTRYNCQSGCDLSNKALKALTASVGGYINEKIENTFIQNEYSHLLKSVTGNTSTVSSTYTTSDDDILTAAPVYFYDKNISLITFASLGNDYIDLKSQYFKFNSTEAASIEHHVGRFLDVKQVQTVAFNQSAVLVGYSVKHPSQSDYNIFVQYISSKATAAPSLSRVVNIYPSYNGIFDLSIVPYSTNANTGISSTEFMISYPESNALLSTKRYKITHNSIKQQLNVNEYINAISSSVDIDQNSPNQVTSKDTFTLKVNAFLEGTYNVIWSYLNEAGVFIQRYNLFNGEKTAAIEILAAGNSQYPQVLRFASDSHSQSIISWQNDNNIYLKNIRQDVSKSAHYQILKFSVCNVSLQDINFVSLETEAVTIGLVENKKQRAMVLDGSSSSLTNMTDLIYSATINNLTVSTSGVAAIETIDHTVDGCNATNVHVTQALDYLRGIIQLLPKQQYNCPINIDNSALYSTFATTKDKQTILNNLQNQIFYLLHNKINLLKISKQILYQIQDISSNAGAKTINSLRETNDMLKNLDFSSVPEVDLSSQIADINNFIDDLANANSEFRKFKTLNTNILQTILSKLKDIVTKMATIDSVEDVIEFVKDIIDEIPFPEEAEPVVEEFKEMLDKIPPYITKILAIELPTSESEICEFLHDPVKDLIIEGLEIVYDPLIHLVEAGKDIVIDMVGGLINQFGDLT